MKKNSAFLFTVIAIVIGVISLQSCAKEGAQGPAGPAGATGATGAQGPTGNANVHSLEITVNPSEWTWNSNNYVYYKDVPFSYITSDVMNYGFVVGYLKGTNNGTSIWQTLPLTFYPTIGVNTSYTWEISYISLGSCRLRFLWSNASSTAPSAAQTFRLVAVSGSAKAAHPNTNWNDPKQVEQVLQNEGVN
jgi:hypothetical protein